MDVFCLKEVEAPPPVPKKRSASICQLDKIDIRFVSVKEGDVNDDVDDDVNDDNDEFCCLTAWVKVV